MLFITAQSLPAFLSFPPHQLLPSLKPRQVPLRQWALQVLVLITGSLLNNWAFAYDVPLTVLIVFRSAGEPIVYSTIPYDFDIYPGLAVSMLFGHFFLKKRYSIVQVVGAITNKRGHIYFISSYTDFSGARIYWRRSCYSLTTIGRWRFIKICINSAVRRFAQIRDGSHNARRFINPHRALGVVSRAYISDIWTLLEGRSVLHGATYPASLIICQTI